jgi:hypothetical protein
MSYVLLQEHGDIKSYIDMQVQCADLQTTGAVYLGVSAEDLAHM